VGDPLSEQSLESFNNELQKLAQGGFFRQAGKFVLNRLRRPKELGLGALGQVGRVTRGVFEGGDKALGRIRHPLEGLRAGWRESSPVNVMKDKAKELGQKLEGRDFSIQEAAQHLKSKIPPKPADRSLWSRVKTGPTEAEKSYSAAQESHDKFMQGGGEHLLGTKPGTGRIKAIAEELSRRGWTGAGPKTKYLPGGMKSWSVLPVGLEIPSIVNAPAPTPTGEGGALEQGLGALGGTAGFIASTGVGLVPGAAMWYGGQKAGSRLGRVLDRIRAGAPLRTAVSAPSPQEAAEQLQTIQQHYG